MAAVSKSEIRAMSLHQLRDVMVARIAARRRIGWFDFSADSYDGRVAMARAVRVWSRLVNGMRMSRQEAMGF